MLLVQLFQRFVVLCLEMTAEMIKFFYQLGFLKVAMPKDLVLFFDNLLQMGLTHLKINNTALKCLYGLLLLFVVLLAFFMFLLVSLKLLQNALVKTFYLVKLDFNIVKLFVLEITDLLLGPKFLLELLVHLLLKL